MKHLLNTLLVCFLATGIAFACPPDGAKAETKVEKTENAAMQAQFASLDLSVKGMTCGGCENKVRAALTGIDGVVETKKVCSQSDRASLTYDPNVVSEEEIMSALKEKTGYAIAVVKSAGMTEADAKEASAKKACTTAQKKQCAKSKASCAKSKASAEKDLEEE
jgi:copper chaperone CopZ